MANGHGGARPGAGRKAKAEKFGGEIAAAERQIADALPSIVARLLYLAEGGFEQLQETWEPAGLIQITKEVITTEGTLNVKELAFPELPPTQLVLTRRTRSVAAPDRAAAQYLVDRILGRPTARLEADDGAGGPLVKVILGVDESLV